ncbi:MAG: penicillin-binding protein 2 [Cycloclasticus sp.]|nr:penicillin-binding protein 2 [Cycloclasticus sp.]
MKLHFDLKSDAQENRLFFSRSVTLIIFALVLFVTLIARLVFLQIQTHEKFSHLAQNNRVNLSAIAPVRGMIFDTQGQVLAENNPSYSLELIPEQIKDLDLTLTELSKILPISEKDITAFKKRKGSNKRFVSTPLRNRLSESEVAIFAANRHLFPGVDIQAHPLRHYPFADISAHLVGYVGAINDKELSQIDPVNYRGTRVIGKTGIEKTYEKTLHGSVGYQQTENTAQGRPIKVISHTAPISGESLTLNIDMRLQKTAYDALGDFNGSVVAIDTQTGAVRVLVSKPGFNTNLFARGIDQKSYTSLQTSSRRPLFNRALQGLYPPGSTLKPFFALAGLDYKATTRHQQVFCPGYYQLPNQKHKYRDWKKTGHGHVSLHEAIEQSCDVFFYALAHDLEINRMHHFLSKFGFGQKTGIDLMGEKSGLLPSKDWKKRARNQVWYPGETLIAGIGQGFNLTTPLQLAQATVLMANKGHAYKPTVVSHSGSQVSTASQWPAIQLGNPNDWDHIIKAMSSVVNGRRGTARKIAEGAPYKIAGKTGTAQVFGIKQDEEYDEETVLEHLKDHALFVAFAPIKKPQLAVAVIVENGSHGGSVAAPIARAVFDQYIQLTP